jgi:hypothetical protein
MKQILFGLMFLLMAVLTSCFRETPYLSKPGDYYQVGKVNDDSTRLFVWGDSLMVTETWSPLVGWKVSKMTVTDRRTGNTTVVVNPDSYFMVPWDND